MTSRPGYFTKKSWDGRHEHAPTICHSRQRDAGMTTQQISAAASLIQEYILDLTSRLPGIEVLAPSAGTARYSHDAATAKPSADAQETGPAVVLPATAAEVQAAVKLAAGLGVTVVPRGAGTGLSGGASARQDQVVISTEKLNRIVEVSRLDEIAVVEPGVINAELNRHLKPFGLFMLRTRQV